MRWSVSVIVVVLGLSVAAFWGSTRSHGAPAARAGVLDLRAWDFEQSGPAPLQGEWEFYWHEFRMPGKPAAASRLATLPGRWTGWELGGRRLPSEGYATFRLRVLMPADAPLLRVNVPQIYSAYVLYANGEPVQVNGRVGTDPATEQPHSIMKSARLPGGAAEVELVLQVSNFFHDRGGPIRLMEIGTARDIEQRADLRRAFFIFMLGSAGMMGLTHSVFWLSRRGDRSLLYFGLLELCLAGFILVSSRTPQQYLHAFPELWSLRAELIAQIAALWLLLAYIRELFPDLTDRSAGRAVTFTLASFAGLALVLPALVFTRWFLFPLEVVALGTLGWLLWCVIQAARHRRPSAGWMLVSTACFFVSVVHDALFYQAVLGTFPIAGYGFLFFSVSQAVMLGTRLSRALESVEALSGDLCRLNAELEERVEARTAALQTASAQKDRILSIIAHDLRTPIEAVVKLGELMERRPTAFDRGEVTKFAREINASARGVLGLLANLLDWARLKTHQTECHPEPVRPGDLLGPVLQLYQPVAQSRGVTLEAGAIADDPVLADRDLLSAVLRNLVANALRFTPPGGRVSATAVRLGTVMVFSVTDDGVGMSEKIQARLRAAPAEPEPFSVESRQGFGLHLVRALLRLHRSRLEIDSQPGEGTEVRFRLAVVAAPRAMECPVPLAATLS